MGRITFLTLILFFPLYNKPKIIPWMPTHIPESKATRPPSSIVGWNITHKSRKIGPNKIRDSILSLFKVSALTGIKSFHKIGVSNICITKVIKIIFNQLILITGTCSFIARLGRPNFVSYIHCLTAKKYHGDPNGNCHNVPQPCRSTNYNYCCTRLHKYGSC